MFASSFDSLLYFSGTAGPAPTPAPGTCGGPRAGSFPSLSNPHTIVGYSTSSSSISDGGQDA